MKDFKQIFGYYPKSVGSWFIDSYTLNYMYKKYNIIASCNCKDQIGTDGYTLWGGYWNQAYFPSLKNAYVPAQTEEGQIPVPIFRMLGSDPVRQYESGIASNGQHVITLEPVSVGSDSTWVNWYFDQFTHGACMEFAYTQVGQENSFIWPKVSKGFEIQLPLIARLQKEKKVKIETLSESGKWFRENYKVTPATAVTVNRDLPGSTKDYKTVWFNSRFFRTNLLWEKGIMRIRDIHLFNENIVSDYLDRASDSDKASFYTLPFIDGHEWSSIDKTAGLYLKIIKDGQEIFLKGDSLLIDDSVSGKLHIVWPLETENSKIVIDIDEISITVKMEGGTDIDWFLDFPICANENLPFNFISDHCVNCNFKGYNYSVNTSGLLSRSNSVSVFRIVPNQNCLVLNFNNPVHI